MLAHTLNKKKKEKKEEEEVRILKPRLLEKKVLRINQYIYIYIYGLSSSYAWCVILSNLLLN